MEMIILSTSVLGLVALFSLFGIIRLKAHRARSERHIRRLERTIEKLNTKNGQLWYDLAKLQDSKFAKREETGFTVTRQ